MSKPKKALVIYLVVSSIILHGILILALIMLGPALKSGYEMGQEFAQVSAGQAKNFGVIKDVSTIEEDGHKYVGYAIEYQGKTQYVMGGPDEGLAVGDRVAVTLTKHPYAPLKSLMIVVTKNGR